MSYPLDRQLRHVLFVLASTAKNVLGLGEMIEELVVEGELKIADGKLRIDLDQLAGRLDAFFVLAEGRVQRMRPAARMDFRSRG